MKRKGQAPPLPEIETSQPTPKELWYLRCLFRLSKHLGRPPTLPELSDYCKKSITPIWFGLDALVRKGLLRREDAVALPTGKKTHGNPARFVIISPELEQDLIALDKEEQEGVA